MRALCIAEGRLERSSELVALHLSKAAILPNEVYEKLLWRGSWRALGDSIRDDYSW